MEFVKKPHKIEQNLFVLTMRGKEIKGVINQTVVELSESTIPQGKKAARNNACLIGTL